MRDNDRYQIKGITHEPTGNSEKSEPQMGFEPTTLCESITDALTTELLETLSFAQFGGWLATSFTQKYRQLYFNDASM